MSRLDTTLDSLIEREGGYVDHPKDRGGPTIWGVTEVVARAHGYTGPMAEMPKSKARAIYITAYWIDTKIVQVATHSQRLADEMLDIAVNMGTAWPGRFLQRALNVLNREARDFPDVAVDGAIGRMTLFALNAYLAKRGAVGELALFRLIDSQQGVRYIEIAEARPANEEFVTGWASNRLGESA